MYIDLKVARHHIQSLLLETVFEQEVILRNKMTCPCQENNQLRPESRHFSDRHVLSKALSRMVGPIKKMALVEGIFCRSFGHYPFSLQISLEY
jgi:hypothetical protein